MNKKLLQSIETTFFAKLQFKTGWGRNEVMALYHEAQREAVFNLLDAPITGQAPMHSIPFRTTGVTASQKTTGTEDDDPPFDVTGGLV